MARRAGRAFTYVCLFDLLNERRAINVREEMRYMYHCNTENILVIDIVYAEWANDYDHLENIFEKQNYFIKTR